jgi:HEAT repeat protein
MITNLEKKIEELMSSEEYDGLGELVQLKKKATPTLVKILSRSRDPLMRKRAAIALGRIKDKTTLKPLVNSLTEKNPVVLISIIEALANVGDRRISKNIIPFLKNKDSSVRCYAARTLGMWKDKNSRAYLQELLDREKLEFIRKEVFKSIEKIGNP